MFDFQSQLRACGLTEAGATYCWGGGYPSYPAREADGFVFTSISTDDRTTCGLATDGTAYCWGTNIHGEAGVGSSGSILYEPTPVAGGLKFKQVVVRNSRVQALTMDGKAYAWGQNHEGALGTGTSGHHDAPIALPTTETFQKLGHFGRVFAITTDGRAFSWGVEPSFSFGQHMPSTPAPVPFSESLRFKDLAVGFGNMMFLSTTGEAYALGYDVAEGQTLYGLTHVVQGMTFNKVAAHSGRHAGITASGDLYIWGWNNRGQIGDSTTTARSTPTLVKGGHRFRDVRMGYDFTAALTEAGELYFWGWNHAGIFGNGASDEESHVPAGPRERNLSIRMSPANPTIAAGQSVDVTITAVRSGGGFATSGINIGVPGSVTLAAVNVPAGITVGFHPSATVPADQNSTVMRLSASSNLTGGVGSFGIRMTGANLPSVPDQPLSVMKVDASGNTGLDLVCTSSSTPGSFPPGYHCMVNSSGALVPGKFAIPTLTSSAWWVDTTAEVCVSWRNTNNRGVSVARFKGTFGSGTTETTGHWGLLSKRSGLLEGAPSARYLFTSNLDAQTQLLSFNETANNVINNYNFVARASCPW
jgi:hypothetical protein